MKNKTLQSCPDASLIESLAANQAIEEQERDKIARHVQVCPSCRIIFNELSRFYSIFGDEIASPPSSSVFDFLNSLDLNGVETIGILLKPVEPLNGHKSLDYFAEIVIAPNPQNSSKFQDITLKRGEILLRAVKSSQTGESMLYLISPHERLYQNIRLQIASEGKLFSSDGTGRLNLGKFDISKFKDQMITVHIRD